MTGRGHSAAFGLSNNNSNDDNNDDCGARWIDVHLCRVAGNTVIPYGK